jgi:Ca-activated chloride channel family protein
MFEDDGGKAARILVLLSDGEDTGLEPSHVSESVLLAAGKGVKVFTVGLGTGKSVRIPMRDEAGARVVNAYIDEEGNPLKTRLEQERLKTIANATGGTYVAATEENAAAVVMDAILKEAREAEYTQGEEQAWWGLAPLLFLAGFLLFAWGMWIGR